MPCNADYLEPSKREVELSRVLCFHDELDGKEFPHKYWQGQHPRVYDQNVSEEEADQWVSHLCHRCGNIDVTKHSLELQIWWRDHQAADKRREQQEAEDTEREIKRQAALAKLTQEDIEALGLN